MLVKSKNFTPVMLKQFHELQTLSFAILQNTAAELDEDHSEKEVARELVHRYRAAGVQSFFHLPVVLFGERTALPGRWTIGKFFPKSRKLRSGDSVILDAAPLFDGFLVDTSYSFCFGDNPVHRQMMANLSRFRDSIRLAVNSGQSFKLIADNVVHQMRDMGYEPVHIKHPGEVLGHRAIKTTGLPFSWRLKGFDAMSLGWFVVKGKLAQHGWGREAPTWNSDITCEHPPLDGLWLVEPHAGKGPIGAKWEEILVITEGQAEWLDDTPPHVHQWSQIAAGNDYGPVSAVPG